MINGPTCPQKNGKRGYVGYYRFYVVVQCFFRTFDVLCGGDVYWAKIDPYLIILAHLDG